MSTTSVETWVTNLAEVGPIYPFVGTEFWLWIAGLAFWIWFHIWQSRAEDKTYAREQQHFSDPETLERAIRAQPIEQPGRTK